MKMIDCVIIPARGGSKRIPKKNMQPFCGIPMLERSIQLAQMVSDCVIVSSDDSAILDFAKRLGAYTILRDASLASDTTPTLPVITNAIIPFLDEEAGHFMAGYATTPTTPYTKDSKNTQCKQHSNTQQEISTPCFDGNLFDSIPLQITLHSTILCLYATAMFATKDILLESYAMLAKYPQASYIVAMLEASKVFRSFTCTDKGFLQFLFPDFINTRSQDLPQAFLDAGQFYLGYAKSFLAQIPLLGQSSMGITLQYAHDIDTMFDLMVAQSLFTHIHNNNKV